MVWLIVKLLIKLIVLPCEVIQRHLTSVSQTDEQSIKIPKEIYISLERRQWTIDERKFIRDNVISKNYTIR